MKDTRLGSVDVFVTKTIVGGHIELDIQITANAKAGEGFALVMHVSDVRTELLQLEAAHPCAQVDRRAFDLAGRCVELRTTLGDAFAFRYTAHVR